MENIKKRPYTIAAIIIAIGFWFFDTSVHYFFYNEEKFEFIPSDANEFWMRSTIAILIILFGTYIDYSTKKLLLKEKQLEANRIYNSMMSASQHILYNLLHQMQIVRIEALKCEGFNKKIITHFDSAIDKASDLVQRLSDIENITDKNITASVDPMKIGASSKKVAPSEEESQQAE